MECLQACVPKLFRKTQISGLSRNCWQKVIKKCMLLNVTENAFLAFTFGIFPENNRNVSDEHRERFHNDIKTVEQIYQESISLTMMAN